MIEYQLYRQSAGELHREAERERLAREAAAARRRRRRAERTGADGGSRRGGADGGRGRWTRAA